MNILSVNLMLAVAWAALWGQFNVGTLSVGFLVGFFSLWLVQPLIGSHQYFFRVFAWVKLVVMFIYELIVSSIHVVVDVVTPTHRSRPGIIEVPLDVKTDAGILLVTNLISLTPGTLSIDVTPDRKNLIVHAMFLDDPQALIHELKSGMEKWVIDAVEGE